MVAVLVLSEQSFSANQSGIRNRYAADFWRQSQGLPQNSVYSLAQTSDGYIWVGTKGGVARFDGVRFTTFDDRDRS